MISSFRIGTIILITGLLVSAGCRSLSYKMVEESAVSGSSPNSVYFYYNPLGLSAKLRQDNSEILAVINDIKIVSVKIEYQWHNLQDIKIITPENTDKLGHFVDERIHIQKKSTKEYVTGLLTALEVSHVKLDKTWYQSPSQASDLKITRSVIEGQKLRKQYGPCPECDAAMYSLFVFPLIVAVILSAL